MTTSLVLAAQGSAFGPAVIAAVAAVIAAVVAAGGAIYNGWRQRLHEERIERITRSRGEREFLVQRLNELYGPLYMIREQNDRLREQLPPRPWRLVDNIEDLKRDPSDPRQDVVESILQLNSDMSELIKGKAGLLLSYPPPASFVEFLEHAELLNTYWARGRNQGEEDRRPFPVKFDEDVRNAIEVIMERLAALAERPRE